MNKILLSLILIVFIAGCTSQYQANSQPPAQQQTPTPAPNNMQTQPTTQTQTPTPAPQPAPSTPTTNTKTFTIQADDSGFYMNNQPTPSISVMKGDIVQITFQVRTQNVYYGGLDFRGCSTTSGSATPGNSATMQFTASNSCTITSYWPATGHVKANLQITVS